MAFHEPNRPAGISVIRVAHRVEWIVRPHKMGQSGPRKAILSVPILVKHLPSNSLYSGQKSVASAYGGFMRIYLPALALPCPRLHFTMRWSRLRGRDGRVENPLSPGDRYRDGLAQWCHRSLEDADADWHDPAEHGDGGAKGDLNGRILYHVTSTFDFANDSLVNTGDQVFSGTVAGSDPVMIHDGRFRFHANLKTGAETGSVQLVDHIAGPSVKCMLQVIGTGKDADANPTFDYTGHCDFQDK